jgi:hypothetical protein
MPSIFDKEQDPSRAEVIFRVLCSLGHSVESQWSALARAAESEGKSWRRILKEIDDATIGQYKTSQATIQVLNKEVALARCIVQLITERYRNGESLLSDVLEEIANSITFASPEKLISRFEQMNKRGYELAQKCVLEWGRPLATQRWEHCKLLPISFNRSRHREEFVLTTVREKPGAEAIIIQVGRSHSFLNYLTLEFQFFHEYLSHVYPVWEEEDQDGLLSEAVLYCMQRQAYKVFGLSIRYFHLNDVVKHDQDDMNEVTKLSVEMEAQFLGKWIEGKRFSTLLLELAATAEADFPFIDKKKFVGMFTRIYYEGDDWNQEKKEAVKKVLNSENEFQQVYKELRQLLFPTELFGAL